MDKKCKRIGTFKKFLSQQRMKKINEANVNIECDWWDACIVEVIQEIDKECSVFLSGRPLSSTARTNGLYLEEHSPSQSMMTTS